MDNERLHELCLTSLVSASELAYVEEAAGTSFLLQCFHEFFQYAVRKPATVLLREELNILGRYVDVQTMRYPGRFSVQVAEGAARGDMFVPAMKLIGFFDSLLSERLMRCDRFLDFTISVRADDSCAEIGCSDGFAAERFCVCLSE